MPKRLFNFYLDDDVKQQVEEKLEKEFGKQEKGALASLIRVQLLMYLAQPKNQTLLDALEAEYTYSQTKNKRSRL